MNEQRTIGALAGEYVLGTLTDAERTQFEAQLQTDPEAAAAVAAWQEHLAPLDPPTEPVEPAPETWSAIKSRIAAEAVTRDFFTIRDGAGDWEDMAPGIAMKILNHDEETGERAFLVRFDAGASDTPHFHHSDEEILMLSGDIAIGDLVLKPGDYHFAPKGTWHGNAHSVEGGLFFVRDRVV